MEWGAPFSARGVNAPKSAHEGGLGANRYFGISKVALLPRTGPKCQSSTIVYGLGGSAVR